MTQKLANNARALLVSSITSGDLVVTVEAGKADLFPVGTTSSWLTPLDWFRATLEDSAGNREIIKVGLRTAGSGVMSNILRGQEGTTARAFPAGSVVELRVTAADVQNALAGTFDQVTIAVKALQAGVEGRITPVGGIIMWSGAVAAIPTGWGLCNGTNGTPDLRDKFVVGAGSSYAVAAIGGAKDAIVVAHNHTASFAGSAMAPHGHTINDPSHSHQTAATVLSAVGGTGVSIPSGYTVTGASLTGVTVVDNSAGTPAGSVTVNNAGAAALNANLPPYYALAFIMCLPA